MEEVGATRRFYSWDGEHNGEVEVWDRRGKHLGVNNPQTGEQIKPAVKGRKERVPQ
jgi:hypothetical protein